MLLSRHRDRKPFLGRNQVVVIVLLRVDPDSVDPAELA